MRAKADVEEKRRHQVRMAQEIKQKQEQKLTLQQYFSSQQEELEIKGEEIVKVSTKISQVSGELDDMQEIIHREREDLMERIRELTREIRMKHLIIDQFIPVHEYQKIERRAMWNDESNDWTILNSEYSGNAIQAMRNKKQEGKLKMGNNPHLENILNLDGDSEEEDFEQAATKRVHEAINSILIDEDEEVQMSYQPPEK